MRLPIVVCASLLVAGCNSSTIALLGLLSVASATGAARQGPVHPRRPPPLETWTILARERGGGGPIVIERRLGERWALVPGGLCAWTQAYTYVGAHWEYPRAVLVGPRGEVCRCWVGDRL